MTTRRVVGRPLPRVDAIEKATGEARYIDDCFADGALYVATFGSPHPHIRIRRLDIAAALQTPGVLRIITAHDLPGPNCLPWSSQPFLVENEACYRGEPIALVIGEKPELARLGVQRIQLDYDILPSATTLQAALSPDAPVVTSSTHGPNIWQRWQAQQGNLEAAFSQSDLLIKQTYQSTFQAAAYLEPTGMIAEPDPDGGVIVYGSLQAPFAVQEALAHLLELPHNRVRVVQRPLGGNGGGKAESACLLAGHAALVAWLTGRPVRLIYQSHEDFLLTGKRHPVHAKLKLGARRNGQLLGYKLDLQLQGGAYPSTIEHELYRAVAHAAGPYSIPHVQVQAKAIATHNVPSAALWGYGQATLTFALESLLDELARRLNIDPIALRKKNLISPGEPSLWGQLSQDAGGLSTLLSQIEERSQWQTKRETYQEEANEEDAPKSRVRRGIGIALSHAGISVGAESPRPDQAMASIQLQRDGTVQVSTAHAETGRGSRTLLAQMVAESLAAPYEAIRILESDTTRVPGMGNSIHTHSLLSSGQALLNATRPLREQILQTAANFLSCTPEEVELRPGRFVGPQEKSISFAQTIELCWQTGMPMAHYGWFALPSPPRTIAQLNNLHFPPATSTFYASSDSLPAIDAFPLPETTETTDTSSHNGTTEPSRDRIPLQDATAQLTQHTHKLYPVNTYAAQIAEVEVDLDTFQIRVCRIYSAHDVGHCINPMLIQSAIESGVLQATGFALSEELQLTDGHFINANFAQYAIPSFRQLPTVTPILTPSPYPEGPYQYKSLGDSPFLAVTPAILNAVAQAVGHRIRELPATPEKLFQLISPESRSNE